MKTLPLIAILCWASTARAETPAQMLAVYESEAARQVPGFQASGQRGGAFFTKQFKVSDKMPACTACHTENPGKPGSHVVTGKTIQPLAPAANAERLTDPAKVEKWFRRNCKEVVGRECAPAEKADFIAYLTGGR
jgi:hypothetical protein